MVEKNAKAYMVLNPLSGKRKVFGKKKNPFLIYLKFKKNS